MFFIMLIQKRKGRGGSKRQRDGTSFSSRLKLVEIGDEIATPLFYFIGRFDFSKSEMMWCACLSVRMSRFLGPRTTSPSPLPTFFHGLSKKKTATYSTRTAAVAFRTACFSTMTISASSAPGPSPASATPGSAVGVAPAAHLCPHR